MKWLSNASRSMLLTAATAGLLNSYVTIVEATEASPHLYEEEAPDGELITLGIVGGPEGSIEQTPDGYDVLDCGPGKRKGFKCYATLNPITGEVEATDIKVSKSARPEKMGLAKGNPHFKKTKYGDDKEANRARHLDEGETTTEEIALRRRTITTGTTKNLVIPIKFSDHVGRALPTREQMEVLMNSDTPDPLCPTGSVKKYFQDASFGALTLDSVVTDWAEVPGTEAYYANGDRGLTTKTHEMIKDALDIVDQYIDFGEFDVDNNGVIDVITFLHSGYGAEWGGTDAYGANYYSRIWSHKWAIYTYSTSDRTFDGVSVYKYHISPAVWGTSGSAIGRIGVIAHETGHFFDLPDLYDTDGNGEGIGSWGLMANSWGFDGSQRYPPKMSPWSLMQVGWLLPAKVNLITSSGNYEAFPSYTGGPDGDKDIVYKISDGFGTGEYLLIENRQKIGFDSAVPKAGLCIWHIDESADNLVQGHPGQTGWPANGQHYRNSLLQADGLYQLEKNLNRGNDGDSYKPGSSIGPSDGDPADGPFPNTDSYKNGVLTKTDITIDNIAANGENFLFSVSFGETITTTSPPQTTTSTPTTTTTITTTSPPQTTTSTPTTTTTITTTSPPQTTTSTPTTTTETELGFADFEDGWDGWVKGGGNDVRRSSNDIQYCPYQTWCVRLRDNSGSESSITQTFSNVNIYDELKVDFSFQAISFEDVEDFFLEYKDASDVDGGYTIVRSWVNGADFINGEADDESVVIAGGLPNSVTLRFRCDASGNGDKLYIDDIKVTGISS